MGRVNQTIDRLSRLFDNSRGQIVKARSAWDRMAIARRFNSSTGQLLKVRKGWRRMSDAAQVVVKKLDRFRRRDAD